MPDEKKTYYIDLGPNTSTFVDREGDDYVVTVERYVVTVERSLARDKVVMKFNPSCYKMLCKGL